MELDELKILFKEKNQGLQPEKTSEEIASMLGRQTNSVIGKLRRSLILEIVISAIFIVACFAAGIFGSYISLRIYFTLFGVVCMLFLFLLIFLLRKINQPGNAVLPVKSNLQRISGILKEYAKRYFQFTMGLIPVSIFFAFFLGYHDTRLHNSSSPLSEKEIILFVVYLVVFSIAMYFFTKWYIKKMYGQYLHQLEKLIQELEE